MNMKRSNIYMALCAIAVGKSIINPGEQLPADVSEAKIQALLANGSIEPSAYADAEKKAAEIKPPVGGDGSGQTLPDASNTEKVAEGVSGEMTATLTGVVTKDGRVVELSALSAAALKKLATDLGVTGAANMKKDVLVEAITAVEFAADK